MVQVVSLPIKFFVSHIVAQQCGESNFTMDTDTFCNRHQHRRASGDESSASLWKANGITKYMKITLREA